MTAFTLPLAEAVLPDAGKFLMAFVPLFVVLDPIGLVPVFLGLTETLALFRSRLRGRCRVDQLPFSRQRRSCVE